MAELATPDGPETVCIHQGGSTSGREPGRQGVYPHEAIPILVKRRKRSVEWEKLMGIDAVRIARIRDRSQSVDIRAERTHTRASIVKMKQASVIRRTG